MSLKFDRCLNRTVNNIIIVKILPTFPSKYGLKIWHPLEPNVFWYFIALKASKANTTTT